MGDDSSDPMISINGGQNGSSSHQSSPAATGNPASYVVSVSQSKRYLFSFMMKDPKNDHKIESKIASLTKPQLKRCQNDPKDNLYYYAPNAFINVIDIVREQVIA